VVVFKNDRTSKILSYIILALASAAILIFIYKNFGYFFPQLG
jgi:hypothetical protein